MDNWKKKKAISRDLNHFLDMEIFLSKFGYQKNYNTTQTNVRAN